MTYPHCEITCIRHTYNVYTNARAQIAHIMCARDTHIGSTPTCDAYPPTYAHMMTKDACVSGIARNTHIGSTCPCKKYPHICRPLRQMAICSINFFRFPGYFHTYIHFLAHFTGRGLGHRLWCPFSISHNNEEKFHSFCKHQVDELQQCQTSYYFQSWSLSSWTYRSGRDWNRSLNHLW